MTMVSSTHLSQRLGVWESAKGFDLKLFLEQVCNERTNWLYLGDGVEMAGCSVVTLEAEAGQSLLRSLRTEIFNSLEIYSKEGL